MADFGKANTYEYSYKDHLGNLRLSYRQNTYLRNQYLLSYENQTQDNANFVIYSPTNAALSTWVGTVRQSGGYRSNNAAKLPAQNGSQTITQIHSKKIVVSAGQRVRVSVRSTFEPTPDIINYQRTMGGTTPEPEPTPKEKPVLPPNRLTLNSPIVVIPAQAQQNIGEVIIPPSPPRINLLGVAQVLGKTLSLQRKKKEETPLSLGEGQGVGQQMNLLGMQNAPASTAKLVLEVYNGNSLLSTQEQYVTQAGATAWEELSIGMVLPANTTSVVAYMKYESGTDVFFDDLKIELSAVPTAMVVQENHYYPFGLGMKGLDYTAPSPNRENKFTFNGQTEKESKLNLNWHETAFRSYDPQLGRFHQIDPLADLFTGINPYQFGYNNPILFNDPTGLAAPTPSPTKKEPKEKTGNIIVFIQGADYHDFRDAVNSAPINVNWNTIHASNIGDAVVKVKKYMDEFGAKVQNMVISTHGNAGYIELDPLDEYKGLFSSTVQKYLNPEAKRKTPTPYKSWIESLEIIASCIADKGNLIFRSCFSGLPEEKGQTSFAELLGQLFDLGGKNKFNLFMNQDYSTGSYKYAFKGTDKETGKKYDWFSQQIIDSPKARKYVNKSYPLYLTDPSHYRRGWLQVTEEGKFKELGKLIPILQGIGMPVILQSIQNNR